MYEYAITGINPWGREAGETVNIAVRKEDEAYVVGKNTFYAYSLDEESTISNHDRVMLACDFYTECMNIAISYVYDDTEVFSDDVEPIDISKLNVAHKVMYIFGSEYISKYLSEDDTSYMAETLRLLCKYNIERGNGYEVSLVRRNSDNSPFPHVTDIFK